MDHITKLESQQNQSFPGSYIVLKHDDINTIIKYEIRTHMQMSIYLEVHKYGVKFGWSNIVKVNDG